MCSYVADRTQSDAPMRSNNGLQARFAATSQLLYSDIWPIWLVVVPGKLPGQPGFTEYYQTWLRHWRLDNSIIQRGVTSDNRS